jgi:RNA polymerase sigma-70 factor (ECF subfamily)
MPRIEAEGALRLLAQLSVALRETLWLREVGGLSYAEIADVQSVSIGTVMSRLHAARKRMARHLAQQGAPASAAGAAKERKEQR